MDKIKFKSRRPELSFNEVLEQYDCTIDDLFHEAENGNLTIYYQVPANLTAKYVCSVKQVFLRFMSGAECNLSKEDDDELLAMCPELNDIFSKLSSKTNQDDLADQVSSALSRFRESIDIQNVVPPDDYQEILSVGPYTYYPNKGKYRAHFIPPRMGLSPVSQLNAQHYRMGGDAIIWLRQVDKFGIFANQNEEFFVMPEPPVTIREAIVANKLFVMKEELDQSNGLSPDGNLSELFKNDYWPEELGIAISAWQAAAAQYKKAKVLKPSELVRNWLEKKHPELKVSGAAFKRITTIANWDKTPGPAENTDPDR